MICIMVSVTDDKLILLITSRSYPKIVMTLVCVLTLDLLLYEYNFYTFYPEKDMLFVGWIKQ